MAEAIAQIGVAQAALSSLNNSTTNPPEFLYTTMGGFVSLAPGVHQGSAVGIAANSKVEFTAPVDNTDDNYVWVINLTEALTVGAGTEFTTANLTGGDTATIIWNVGAAVTLGAGTEFIGTAFVGGAFGAATSTVSCGNIYATGAVSIGSISAAGGCPTNASSAVDIIIYATGAMTLRPRDAICTTTPSGLHTLITSGAAAHYVSDSSYDDSGSILFVNFSVTLASGHEERWAVHVDTHDFVHTALRYPLHINYVKLSPPPHVTIQVDTDSAWGVGRPAARACLAALWGAVTD